jgi:pyruvate formate lyase activating enzyme
MGSSDSEQKAKIFNIQRYSLNDGPGIRTILFFKGCPLRCKWCSNPESQSFQDQVVFKPDLCIGCGACVEVCPSGIRAEADFTVCGIACGRCVDACPTNAMEKIGRDVAVDEALFEVEKDRAFYEKSQGGLTLSGGEPLSQSAFATALIRAAKSLGLHTAVETTGFAPEAEMSSALDEADLVMYDIKHLDDKTHEKYTGVSNALILGNLRKLADKRADRVTVRVPLIGGVNDDESHMRALAEFVKDLDIGRVDLLPYHRYGEGKYKKLYQPYDFEAYTPEDAEIERCIDMMATYGISAKKSG